MTIEKSISFAVLALVLAAVLTGTVPAAQYQEAPALAERVAAGELPPVEDRLPLDPYVVEVRDRIGDYGGTVRSATMGIEFAGEDTMLFDVMNSFVRPDAELKDVVPNFAKEIEVSEDEATFVIHLRRGVKWSDGAPFGVHDIMFWYEDVLQNEDLTPTIGINWRHGGEVVEVEALDDYRVQFTFAAPNPYFLNRLVHDVSWLLYPSHYLQAFHPHYVEEAELAEKTEKAGFDNWYELFGNKNSAWAQQPMDPDRPTLTAFKMVEKTSSRRVYERNPYFWKVDSDGNQLPYIDRIETEVVSDVEVLNGMIMSGDVDFAAYHMDIRNYPLLRSYEDEGGYRTMLWEGGYSNEANYMINMTHEDPAVREIFQDVRFRQALSLAIDRQELNDVIYYGNAVPKQFTVLETSPYYREEYAQSYAEFDPGRSETLLDEMGLDQKDSEGFRLRPDGERLTFTIQFPELDTPTGPNVELVTQYWNEVGIDVRAEEISTSLQSERATANLQDATVWAGVGSDILFPIRGLEFVPVSPTWECTKWTAWAAYFHSGGETGEEPPEQIKELRQWWEDIQMEPDPEKRDELAMNIVRSQAENLWNIGTIGETPWPVVANVRLGNVPETGLFSWSGPWLSNLDPEQIFFEDGRRE